MNHGPEMDRVVLQYSGHGKGLIPVKLSIPGARRKPMSNVDPILNSDYSTPPLDVTCPHCQASLAVHASQAGMAAECPRCRGRFQVPLPTAHSVRNPVNAGPYHLPLEARDFIGKKTAAGLCGILLGFLGVHKFILGLNESAGVMLAFSLGGLVLTPCLLFPILGFLAMWVIGFVEGILYLTKTDEEFYQTYAVEKRKWF